MGRPRKIKLSLSVNDAEIIGLALWFFKEFETEEDADRAHVLAKMIDDELRKLAGPIQEMEYLSEGVWMHPDGTLESR